jgi:hypothetical protein
MSEVLGDPFGTGDDCPIPHTERTDGPPGILRPSSAYIDWVLQHGVPNAPVPQTLEQPDNQGEA